MKTYEFWRERGTGEVWAVELREGVVVGCCGPLDHSEVDEAFFETFDYSSDRAAWVEAHREAFDLYDLYDLVPTPVGGRRSATGGGAMTGESAAVPTARGDVDEMVGATTGAGADVSLGLSEANIREQLEQELLRAMDVEGDRLVDRPTAYAIAHSVARILHEDHLRVAEQLERAGVVLRG